MWGAVYVSERTVGPRLSLKLLLPVLLLPMMLLLLLLLLPWKS